MVARITILWILGLITAVPYCTYHLLFHAPRDQYAILITFVLFWVFGFWATIAPLLSLVKIRRFYKSFENTKSLEQLKEIIKNQNSEEAAIELIKLEHRIPSFVAKKLYYLAVSKLK